MELLIYGIPHRVAHDLESVMYLLIFICTHLQGPRNALSDTPLYGGDGNHEHPSPLKEWFRITNPENLGHMKIGHIIINFKSQVLHHISPYFNPLKPYISALLTILFPKLLLDEKATHSPATCRDFINIFKTVFEDKALIEEAKQSSTILGKRSHPGEPITAPDGWGSVEPTKKQLSTDPKNKPTTHRNRTFFTRSHRKTRGN
jgi:hypothetical protein